jgi:hypothetical protein
MRSVHLRGKVGVSADLVRVRVRFGFGEGEGESAHLRGEVGVSADLRSAEEQREVDEVAAQRGGDLRVVRLAMRGTCRR